MYVCTSAGYFFFFFFFVSRYARVGKRLSNLVHAARYVGTWEECGDEYDIGSRVDFLGGKACTRTLGWC